MLSVEKTPQQHTVAKRDQHTGYTNFINHRLAHGVSAAIFKNNLCS